jgi:hypothetical protein
MVQYGDSTFYYSRIGDRHLRYPGNLRSSNPCLLSSTEPDNVASNAGQALRYSSNIVVDVGSQRAVDVVVDVGGHRAVHILALLEHRLLIFGPVQSLLHSRAPGEGVLRAVEHHDEAVALAPRPATNAQNIKASGVPRNADLLEIEGLCTQGWPPGRTFGEAADGILETDSSDRSKGFRYHFFVTISDTEFNSRIEGLKYGEGHLERHLAGPGTHLGHHLVPAVVAQLGAQLFVVHVLHGIHVVGALLPQLGAGLDVAAQVELKAVFDSSSSYLVSSA